MGKLYVDPYWFLCKKLSFSYQEHFEILKKGVLNGGVRFVIESQQ